MPSRARFFCFASSGFCVKQGSEFAPPRRRGPSAAQPQPNGKIGIHHRERRVRRDFFISKSLSLSPPRLRGEFSISSQLANNFDYSSAEPFGRLRVSGFLPLMVSLSNHVNSVLLSMIISAACANFPGDETPRIRIFLAPRRKVTG